MDTVKDYVPKTRKLRRKTLDKFWLSKLKKDELVPVAKVIFSRKKSLDTCPRRNKLYYIKPLVSNEETSIQVEEQHPQVETLQSREARSSSMLYLRTKTIASVTVKLNKNNETESCTIVYNILILQ